MATKDFTKFGISVYPDQCTFFDTYDMATKNVNALKDYYQQHLDLLEEKKEAKIQR